MGARSDYIAGLHALADLLEAHEELPLPTQGAYDFAPMTFVFGAGDEARDRIAAAVRTIGGNWSKTTTENTELGLAHLRLVGRIDGLTVQLVADRDAVCTRVVKGTREVTEEVPDPDAPLVTVTRTVEDVEWDCGPILASSREHAAAVTS